MPAVQTSYPSTMPKGTVGQLADTAHCDFISRECENSSGIGFGLAVIQGTNDHGANIGGDGHFLGLTHKDVTLDASRSDKYAQYDSMAIMGKGAMWVTAVKACVPGDPVYRKSDGTLTNLLGARTAAAVAGSNTGTGVMGAITVSGAIQDGVYTLKITAASSGAGSFVITDKNGDIIGPVGTVAAAYSFGGLAFTLADGTPDFAVGDTFAITVSGGGTLIPNARWETTAAADGDLAKVRLL